MFDDLPPDLERLQTLRVWHAMWLARIDRKIAAIRTRQAETERGRRNRPRPPEWIVELGIGNGSPPVQVHAGDSPLPGNRRRPASRDEARRPLAAGLPACSHCQPDTRLHILDLATPTGTARTSGYPTTTRRRSHSSSGHVVTVSPVSSSTRVIRTPWRFPYSPIQPENFRNAVVSLAHRPCITGRPPAVRVRR
ncbi:DUF6233 domain-containing protein [Streptomyces mexicanus]|uniref:DUF6233 domain-containing protein n=1 Tax=Streptomyces mexicanus TaxID=178566 RepID=UPI001F32EF71|nr:DUF6233 domain-containing protein [Streptomyces mexicanus]